MDIAKLRKKLREQRAKSGLSEAHDASKEADAEAVSEEAEPELREKSPPPPPLPEPEAEPEPEPDDKPAVPDPVPAEEGPEPDDEGLVPDKVEAPEEEDPAGPEDDAVEPVSEDLTELLTFKLAGEYYAFRVMNVSEVLRQQVITSVPRAGEFIVGITSLRGTIIPVMSLKMRLSIKDDADILKSSKIIILKGSGKGLIGAMADLILDVIEVSEDEIKPPPVHLADSDAKFIEGITADKERFISILNPDELLNFNLTGRG